MQIQTYFILSRAELTSQLSLLTDVTDVKMPCCSPSHGKHGTDKDSSNEAADLSDCPALTTRGQIGLVS